MNTATTPGEALALMVEYEMATLEHIRLRKSTAKSDITRHEKIVASGLEWCRQFSSATEIHNVRAFRVERNLFGDKETKRLFGEE